MNPPILESDLSDPRRKTLNPALKFALELGPGLVFFFTTIRGEWLAQKFPILTHLGEPLLKLIEPFSDLMESAIEPDFCERLLDASGDFRKASVEPRLIDVRV